APKTPKPTTVTPEPTTVTPVPSTPAGERDIRTLKYTAFELKYDCKHRTALRWFYVMGKDVGSAKRPSSFYMDPNMPEGCLQQKSTKAYSRGYDRGHLVASNHMDTDASIIHESHYMNNIVPQVARFNQGIWAQTEVVQECYRDIQPVTTYGGVIYTNDTSADIFVDGWGIRTPTFFWKVVLTKDDKTGADKIISWYFPNKEGLGKLDEYLVSVNYIESKLNDGLGPIPISDALKSEVAPKTWDIPQNCD
ncbi:endonuclease, partial [Achlya hypogyna]